jgi:hypothetical protein
MAFSRLKTIISPYHSIILGAIIEEIKSGFVGAADEDIV